MTIPSLAVHSDVDMIARGAAIAAGLADGVLIWKDIDCVPQLPETTIYEQKEGTVMDSQKIWQELNLVDPAR